MAEPIQTIPGPPLKHFTITYGADLIAHISRTADGVDAPFTLGTRAFVRLGDYQEQGVIDCDIEDGVIILRIESEVLDEFKRGVSYVLLTSLPTDPTTETAYLAGNLVRDPRS